MLESLHIGIVIIFEIIVIVGMVLLVKVPLFKVFNIEFVRFLGVGVLNTLNYYIFFALLNSSLNYIFAHVLAFLLSAVISYFITTYYTFNSKPSFDTFIRFPLSFLPNFILSTVGTYLFVNFLNTNENYTSTIMLILAIPITFLINKFIFRKENNV